MCPFKCSNSILGLIATGCSVSCKEHPVGPNYRGSYKVTPDNKLHFIGVDDNFNNVDIIIPAKYYSLDNGDLECICYFRG